MAHRTFPKPEPRERFKARRKRQEAALVQEVRPQVLARDGPCRLRRVRLFGPCDGVPEWAHFGESQRWRTRGLPPQERHTIEGSLMLCTWHHELYDGRRYRGGHRMRITALTERRCAGPLRYQLGETVYEEAA